MWTMVTLDGYFTHSTGQATKKPHRGSRSEPCSVTVGTAGFEYSGPPAGPLFFRHLSPRNDAIGTHWRPWTGKLYGKLPQTVRVRKLQPGLALRYAPSRS